MTDPIHIWFDGLNSPIRLQGCPELVGAIRQILPQWPFVIAPVSDDIEVAATIRSVGNRRYEIEPRTGYGGDRRYDTVDAICDMIVQLSWELLRSGQWLMCLHAAAIEMAGRLVIVPNMRRAGKSTLTACLAARGHRVFSDDFFPVSLSGDGYLQGHATGICPRLRLPVPEGFSAGFQEWVQAHSGPGNRRYQYLALPELPRHGAACPLGSIVVLDRRETGSVEFGELDLAEAIAGLLYQNFARSVHSGTILQSVSELLSAVRPYRLSYSSAEEAAEFLEGRFGDWSDAPALVGNAPAFRLVAEEDLANPRPNFDPSLAYVRSEGFLEVAMNDDHYLSDGSGLGIHRLNKGALAIWRLLEEPMRLDQICDVLAVAFPDTPHETIERDSSQALRMFVENRLASAAASGVLV
ncbi:MAG: PqqD family protein [Paracoccaceae bacterium]|nr:PqqD family protein [Paracoccaceae bacterium]